MIKEFNSIKKSIKEPSLEYPIKIYSENELETQFGVLFRINYNEYAYIYMRYFYMSKMHRLKSDIMNGELI